jgi:dihydrofolate synthase/folylpolyglutamate synthase
MNPSTEKKSLYQQTLDYLFDQLPMFQRIGPAAFRKDLTNTLALCEYLGHPERQFPSVHIAGTNGKGSTAHLLAAIFTARGLKTGLYTSPHYRDFRERIKIDGKYISRRRIVDFVAKHRDLFEQVKPSFFEWTVALAFFHFALEKVDIAIIETGLGGRLDSTNVITPLLSVITNISFDHQEFLGNTLPVIAAEKAGIIKPGVPVVIGETQQETQPVFDAKAQKMQSPVFYADQHYQAIPLEKTGSHTFYQVLKDGQPCFDRLPLEHLGDYQQRNLSTALQAVEVLDAHFSFLAPNGNKDVTQGLSRLKSLSGFLGRWEIIAHRPTILLDSAHNEGGIRLAVEGLKSMEFKHLHIVFGTVADKSLNEVLPLLPQTATYYFAKANIPRGKNAALLQEEAAQFGLHGKAYASVRHALEAAKRKAKPEDLIFVSGSIFVVAEVV